MPSRVLLTVDTELRWSHYVQGASPQDNLALSFDPSGVGVPFQLKVLAENGLKACFFVDPMPALVYGIEPIRQMVEPILAAGQEVQLHAHPVWLSVAQAKAEHDGFELTCFDGEAQRALIRTAKDLLVEAGAPEPIAFRAGSYAANADTLDALRSLGISYDSSHNGSYHSDPNALPLDRELIAPTQCRGIVEIPIGQIQAGRRRLRHLQICAVSNSELRQALLHAARNGHELTTIVSHSFELATRDGLRKNRTVCRRFEDLCVFLRRNSEVLPTTHFSDLGDLPLGRPAFPLPARRLRSASRILQQLWSNLQDGRWL